MIANDLLSWCAVGVFMAHVNIVIAVVMLVRLMRTESDFADKKINLLKDYVTTQVRTLDELKEHLQEDLQRRQEKSDGNG